VEAYLQSRPPVVISTLTLVEMRALLGRRRREREIDAKTELRVLATLEEDIRQGRLDSD
jgi:hypothetical protein